VEIPAEPISVSEDGSEQISEDWEWIRKAEAASRLGISERTIENRVNSGKLRKRLRNDGTVEILVRKPSEDLQVDKALVLLDRYNTAVNLQVTPLVERIAAQAETIGELRKENEILRKRLEDLEQISSVPRWMFWKRGQGQYQLR